MIGYTQVPFKAGLLESTVEYFYVLLLLLLNIAKYNFQLESCVEMIFYDDYFYNFNKSILELHLKITHKQAHTHTHIYIYGIAFDDWTQTRSHTHAHTHIYIYIYIYV